MRPAVVILRDLAKDDVRELTRLLFRRLEYGIARPSDIWLKRQEEKIENLPKSLLSSKNMVQRFALSLVSKYDRNLRDEDKLLPPGAVLCHSHESLNAYLIRNIFLILVYEVSGDHMGALRVWPGKTPVIAAFLTRINSLHALWLSRQAFEALFGTAPYDDHYVQVQNNCEACILSAIGANENILADLYGWLTVRRDDIKKLNEQHKAHGNGRRKRPILLYRIVDAWIKHLTPENIGVVRRRGERVIRELKQIWESAMKIKDDIMHRNKKEKHCEVHLSKKGKPKMIEVRGRSHGFGIPLPRAHLGTVTVQRNILSLDRNLDAKSICRADTIVNDADKLDPEKVIDNLYLPESNTRHSLGGESSQRMSDILDIKPPFEPIPQCFMTQTPLSRPIVDDDDELSENDQLCQHEYDERDYVAEAKSMAKVQSWYQQQIVTATNTKFDKLDHENIHPAFWRPMTSRSAAPPPLHLRHSGREPSSHPAYAKWSQTSKEDTDQELDLFNAGGKSVWTDVSVNTTTDAIEGVSLSNLPPVLQMPAKDCTQYGAGSRISTPATPSMISLATDRGSCQTFPSTSPCNVTVGRGEVYINCHSSQALPLPSYLYKRPPSRPPQTEADRRKYLFNDSDSDVATHLTQNNQKYLGQHSGEIREVPAANNPFVRQGSIWENRATCSRTKGCHRYEGYAVMNCKDEEQESKNHQQQKHQTDSPYPNALLISQVAPQGSSTWLEIKSDLDNEEAQWQENQEQDELRPLDSVSNLNCKGRC